jgi:putative membrane protein
MDGAMMVETHLMNNSRTALSTTALVFLILPFSAALAEESALNRTDKTFVKGAYEDGLAEIRLAEIGQAKASNAEVKAFASKMAADHTAANAEIKVLAELKKVELPNAPAPGTDRKANFLDSKASIEFDQSFVETMVVDHKKAVIAFEKIALGAKDAGVKAFATKTLPTLRSHLAMAEELQKKIGK